MSLQKKKDVEKEKRIRHLSLNLSKEDLDNKKKEINDAHIKDCVQQRMIVSRRCFVTSLSCVSALSYIAIPDVCTICYCTFF